MGFRYRKSINLGGGFRVNISKSGIGYSWGVKGYRITKTADGRVRQTASIPGTGISYVEEHSIKKKSSESSKNIIEAFSFFKLGNVSLVFIFNCFFSSFWIERRSFFPKI